MINNTPTLIGSRSRIYIAIIFAIAGYFLSVVSEATQDTVVIASYIAGGFELVFFLISTPLAYFAGKKIRAITQNQGSPGIRLVSWIMYGVAIPHALLFFRWGLIAGGNNRIPNGQIPMNATVFFVAAMLMIADAWNSYKTQTPK
jgi:hypothetical protein